MKFDRSVEFVKTWRATLMRSCLISNNDFFRCSIIINLSLVRHDNYHDKINEPCLQRRKNRVRVIQLFRTQQRITFICLKDHTFKKQEN